MSPWTRKQVRKLLSNGSPLDEMQKRKMKKELHSDPSLGHARKGSKAMKRSKGGKRDYQPHVGIA